MSLTEKQVSAFQTATGTGEGGMTVVHQLFSYGLMGLVLVWAAWITLNAYKAWASKRSTPGEAAAAYVRSILLILILVAFFGSRA